MEMPQILCPSRDSHFDFSVGVSNGSYYNGASYL